MVNDTAEGDVYYDTVTNAIMIVSGRESKFHKVDEYINCSQKDLENVLKSWSSDSTLQIISCNKTKKATILHFRVSSSLNGSQDNIIYFIHYKKKDIQFSFLYKSEFNNDREKYVDNIMGTLKLK